MPVRNIRERIAMSFQFSGIWISGFLPFRVVCFAFFAIKRIRIPVRPPEITPPIPSMKAKPMNSNCVTRM